MPRLIAFTRGTVDPASRFRVLQYLPLWKHDGWTVSHRPLDPPRPEEDGREKTVSDRLLSPYSRWMRRRNRTRDIHDAADYDIVFLNRDLLSGDLRWEQRLFRANPRVVFDFDDAIFLGKKRMRHFEWVCRNAARVIAGNDYLAAAASRFTSRVTVIPTAVDTSACKVRGYNEPQRGPLRLGWMGSAHSIRGTLLPHITMLADLQRQLGFEFVVVTHPRPTMPDPNLRWTFVPWTPETETRIAEHIDVGIMPLIDDDFQRGKCALKLLQYMAAALPVIASPVGVNRDIAPRGGFLAISSDEWFECIKRLIDSLGERKARGQAGRAYCVQQFDLRYWSREFTAIFESFRVPAITRTPAANCPLINAL